MANDKWLKDLGDKLNNHGSEVNPQMWQAVSSQIGTGAAATSAAIGVGKIAAIVVGVAAVSVASYFGLKSDSPSSLPSPSKTEVAETKKNIEIKPETIEKTNIETPVKEKVVNPTIERVLPTVVEKPVQPEVMQEHISESIQIKVPAVIGLRTIGKNTVETPSSPSTIPKAKTPEKSTSVVKVEKVETADKANYTVKTNCNVFTPNGDGVNDYFEVFSEGLTDYSIVIMDAKNTKVWESNDPNARWDGTDLSGQKVATGRYLCLIAGKGSDGKSFGKHEVLNIRY